MTGEALHTYLRDCAAFSSPIWVAGHPAPDTDAVVSSLFEAWRMTMGGTPAIPVLQGHLSRETAFLLGDVTFPKITAQSGTWVLTDHHDVTAYDGEVVGVVDHHPVAEGVNLAKIDACIRPVGAATTLVVQRIREDGISLDGACARILLGAVLLDTEGLSSHKAKAEDVEVAAWLSALCGEEPTALYAVLKEQLLSESDPTVLYDRDYRVYTDLDGIPVMGFAILKVKQGHCPDLAAVRRRLAQDVTTHGYAVAVAKVALYASDDTREEIYLAAGSAAAEVLTEVMLRSGDGAVRTAPDEVFLPADCYHWGRKRYALRFVEFLTKKAEKSQ